MLCVL